MAGVLDHRGVALGRLRGDPSRSAAVALVARAGERQHRHVEHLQPAPDRLHRPLAGGPQQHRQRARVLRQPAGPLGLDQPLGLVGEQRLALPDLDDLLDRLGLHPGGELLVGLLARGTRRRLVDPRRGAEHDDRRVATRIAHARR